MSTYHHSFETHFVEQFLGHKWTALIYVLLFSQCSGLGHIEDGQAARDSDWLGSYSYRYLMHYSAELELQPSGEYDFVGGQRAEKKSEFSGEWIDSNGVIIFDPPLTLDFHHRNVSALTKTTRGGKRMLSTVECQQEIEEIGFGIYTFSFIQGGDESRLELELIELRNSLEDMGWQPEEIEKAISNAASRIE